MEYNIIARSGYISHVFNMGGFSVTLTKAGIPQPDESFSFEIEKHQDVDNLPENFIEIVSYINKCVNFNNSLNFLRNHFYEKTIRLPKTTISVL